MTILGRDGGIPFATSEDCIFTSGQTESDIHLSTADGRSINALRKKESTIWQVKFYERSDVDDVTKLTDEVKKETPIVSGALTIVQEDSHDPNFRYVFTRDDAKNALTIPKGAIMLMEHEGQGADYEAVIFIGQNGGWDNPEDLIRQQRAIINHQANPDKFLIVGLHTKTADERKELETAMKEEYGERYLNLREYMATDAMSDAGLTPTDTDQEMMAKGMTPESLLSDGLHFNATGYRLVGEKIFQKLRELGDLD